MGSPSLGAIRQQDLIAASQQVIDAGRTQQPAHLVFIVGVSVEVDPSSAAPCLSEGIIIKETHRGVFEVRTEPEIRGPVTEHIDGLPGIKTKR